MSMFIFHSRDDHRCILYARSAPTDAHGQNSLAAQIADLRAYAGRHGMVIVDEVQSVGVARNEAVQEMDNLIRRKTENCDFDILLVTGFDRVSRSFAAGMGINKAFRDAGIEVIDVRHFSRCRYLPKIIYLSRPPKPKRPKGYIRPARFDE